MKSCNENKKYFFLAVNTGFVANGLPDQRCYNFYVDRSRHGLHCAIVGNVVIPDGVGSNNVCATISGEEAWRRLALGILEQGALPGIQLSSAWQGFNGMKKFVPRSLDDNISEYRRLAISISPTDIRNAFDALKRGTELAIQAGFRHVQLHAAHGYLFNMMIDHRFSPHCDLALESIRKWANDLALAGVESSLRFSLYAGTPSIDLHGQDEFLTSITALPVCYFDISAGFYNIDKRVIYPSLEKQLLSRHHATLELAKSQPNMQFIMSGKAANYSGTTLPANVHIGICRDLIANPNFLRDRSSGCTDCMKCHYYSRGQSHLTCGRWSDDEKLHS